MQPNYNISKAAVIAQAKNAELFLEAAEKYVGERTRATLDNREAVEKE